MSCFLLAQKAALVSLKRVFSSVGVRRGSFGMSLMTLDSTFGTGLKLFFFTLNPFWVLKWYSQYSEKEV